jgi:hypothetical protein
VGGGTSRGDNRQACKESVQANLAREAAKPGFAACRQAFKTSMQGCPPASPSGAFLN